LGSRLTEQPYDFLRRTIAVDIRIAMSALHVLGIVVLDSGTDQEKADDSADLTAPGRNAVRRVRGMAQPGDAILQLRITLADVADPPVWRRVLIPSAYPLDRVHRVIQATMGWQDYHLHAFRLGDATYAAPRP
jgi:Plasmid pRiA4b ORF-3-like protein